MASIACTRADWSASRAICEFFRLVVPPRSVRTRAENVTDITSRMDRMPRTMISAEPERRERGGRREGKVMEGPFRGYFLKRQGVRPSGPHSVLFSV